MGGEEEKALHEEDQNSLPNDFEKDEETSHEKEEEYLETIEYHSETNSTMDMDQRASTDGCLNYKDEYLVSANEEPRSTSPSPLELQGVDQIQNEEEEEVHSHEPSLI